MCMQVVLPDGDMCDVTLPTGLEVRPSDLPQAGMGVFTVQQIDSDVRFGPYVGEILELSDEQRAFKSGYCWLVSGVVYCQCALK